ncbi:hypothetical protein RJ639_041156, partial [Escallonia herrerae]
MDETTKITVRIYGCDLIQSWVAASCVWLAAKLEECPWPARQVIRVFLRIKCRRQNSPIEHLDSRLKVRKFTELKMDLIVKERRLSKEMGFICHLEHTHKLIRSYLPTLETPPDLRQEACNLAKLCCLWVLYAAARRRFQVPIPENPSWWKAFDADKSGIDEVSRVLAHLCSLPKAHYIPVCNDRGSSRHLIHGIHQLSKYH